MKATITLNGEERIINKNLTIKDLVRDLKLDLEKIAIERNLEIIQNNDFESTQICDGDNIEIVSFIGGG
jgi:thiamine biosynthesis protein ThiS